MPFNFVAVVFTQINFLTDLVQTNCDFTKKTAVFAFLSPLFGVPPPQIIILLVKGTRPLLGAQT